MIGLATNQGPDFPEGPRGFSFAGVHAGIKASRKDLALIFSDAPCAAAGAFTTNSVRAAPVEDAAARLPAMGIRALVINSGNANALTGSEGRLGVSQVRRAVAEALSVDYDAVLTASTGVIGYPFPAPKVVAAAEHLVSRLGRRMETAAEAILTTDTRIKVTRRNVRIGGVDVALAAIGKGSGMVAPSLATVLACVVTDVAISPTMLKALLDAAVEESFHSLVIDGEMSTNDSIIVLANGRAGNPPIGEGSPEYAALLEALTGICQDLAKAVAEDGEGATKFMEARVQGALSKRDAREFAKSIVGSTLVKTSLFGSDPNWGRILATVGARAGARGLPFDLDKVSVDIQGVRVFEHGGPLPFHGPALRAKMREPSIAIVVDLGLGEASSVAWGCDLSYDYIKISADYMSFTGATSEGVVSRDDRLTNYSPTFKRMLLVEALSYIARFSKKRAVIKFGESALIRDSLKASFSNDVNLLRSAGLLPIVVHGGQSEIHQALGTAKSALEQASGSLGVAVGDEARLLEMVLSGKINSELVTRLNQGKALAVGVSGKDAGLLRCRRAQGLSGDDHGAHGEVTSVHHELLDVLLDRQYVPVVSPIGLGEDGEGYHLDADAVAAEIAVAVKADKLIFLSEAPGIVIGGDLISEMGADRLKDKLSAGLVDPKMLPKARSCLRALEGGVESVHIIDGRVPHNLIAELFTDRGVGTLVVSDERSGGLETIQ